MKTVLFASLSLFSAIASAGNIPSTFFLLPPKPGQAVLFNSLLVGPSCLTVSTEVGSPQVVGNPSDQKLDKQAFESFVLGDLSTLREDQRTKILESSPVFGKAVKEIGEGFSDGNKLSYAFVLTQTNFDPVVVKSAQVNDYGRAALASPTDWKSECGEEYISRANPGAYLLTAVVLEFRDASSKHAFENTLSGQYTKTLEDVKERISGLYPDELPRVITVHEIQAGGKRQAISSGSGFSFEFPTSIENLSYQKIYFTSNSYTSANPFADVAAVLEQIKKSVPEIQSSALKYPAIVSYGTESYSTLGILPKSAN